MARARKTPETSEDDRFTLELEPDPALGLGDHDDYEDDDLHGIHLESVETLATIDAIEPDGDDEDDEHEHYRISFHANVSEAAAQQLFATFVRKGRIRLALLPAEDDEHFTVGA